MPENTTPDGERVTTHADWMRAVAGLLDERAPGLPVQRDSKDVWLSASASTGKAVVADAWRRLRAAPGATWEMGDTPAVVRLRVPLSAGGNAVFVFWPEDIGARKEEVVATTTAERWVLPGDDEADNGDAEAGR
jgi:hypothetical protein